MSDETEEKTGALFSLGMYAQAAISVELTGDGAAVLPVGASAAHPGIHVQVVELDMTDAFRALRAGNVFHGGRTYENWVQLIGYSAAARYLEAALASLRVELARLAGPATKNEELLSTPNGETPPKAQA